MLSWLDLRSRWICGAAFVAVLGCKESTDVVDTGTSQPDAVVAVDSGAEDSGVDSDVGEVDTGTSRDAATFPDATSTSDSGAMQGPVCAELEACCPSLSSLGQTRCFNTAGAWDEAACQQSLSLAQRADYCLPPGHDAGVPGDAGPLGPACTELLACCPTLPFLQTQCFNNANSGDETTCQNAIDLARRINQCEPMVDGGEPLDADLSDVGTSTDADAGVPDADTSTTTDAG
ncbi:MAG: hypothetical protein HY791_37435 [Deltaproteobacteria bacterium]|nr:hypothetical protein [Deltaproteobacteria bacterium]